MNVSNCCEKMKKEGSCQKFLACVVCKRALCHEVSSCEPFIDNNCQIEGHYCHPDGIFCVACYTQKK